MKNSAGRIRPEQVPGFLRNGSIYSLGRLDEKIVYLVLVDVLLHCRISGITVLVRDTNDDPGKSNLECFSDVNFLDKIYLPNQAAKNLLYVREKPVIKPWYVGNWNVFLMRCSHDLPGNG